MIKKYLIAVALVSILVSLSLLLLFSWRSQFGRDVRQHGFRRAAMIRTLDGNYSDKPLGAIIDHDQQRTIFRFFAPTASRVDVLLFNDALELHRVSDAQPAAAYRLVSDRNGVWEFASDELLVGAHYCYRIETKDVVRYVGDPYARGFSGDRMTSIAIDTEAVNQWFLGWQTASFARPAVQDLTIYEASIRNFTSHPSAGVERDRRGTFRGFSEASRFGTGGYHLQRLGVNAVNLSSLAGLNSTYPFSPSTAYAMRSEQGSQHFELKQLIDDLHANGLAVILDLTLPFRATPELLADIDQAYFISPRTNGDVADGSPLRPVIRLDAPMYRRMVRDMISTWIRDFKIDGLKLLHASLYGEELMLEIRDAALAIDPSFILIADLRESDDEFSSFLHSIGWLTVDDGYAQALIPCIRGEVAPTVLKRAFADLAESPQIAGASRRIAAYTRRDGMTVADMLSTDASFDASVVPPQDLRRNLIATALLAFTPSPMFIAEGQDFLHSKGGQDRTGEMGDRVNALRWNARNTNAGRASIAYMNGLLNLRNSPLGRSLKNVGAFGPESFDWIATDDDGLFGFIVNKAGRIEGGRFIILFNIGERPRYIQVDFPEGTWRIIARGQDFNADGVPGSHRISGPRERQELISPVSISIYMSM